MVAPFCASCKTGATPTVPVGPTKGESWTGRSTARSPTRLRSSRRRPSAVYRFSSRARPAAGRPGSSRRWPTTSAAQIYTVAGHEDLTSADLVGRFLLKGGETTWVDGPLTRAVREGAIAYLDEVVEARQDTTVVIHPLTDHRRQLPVDRLGITLDAAPGFQLVISYNPGYQSVLKDLKDSTRQRFVAIELDFPPADLETEIVAHEAGISVEVAQALVKVGYAIRNLDGAPLREVASTRALILAGGLAAGGLPLRRAVRSAIVEILSDDPDMIRALGELVDAFLPES